MSDPFADVNIDEDIDILNPGNKVCKDDHSQALKLMEDDQPEASQGNLQLHPHLEAQGVAQIELVGGLRTSNRVSKRGFIDTDNEMNNAVPCGEGITR